MLRRTPYSFLLVGKHKLPADQAHICLLADLHAAFGQSMEIMLKNRSNCITRKLKKKKYNFVIDLMPNARAHKYKNIKGPKKGIFQYIKCAVEPR